MAGINSNTKLMLHLNQNLDDESLLDHTVTGHNFAYNASGKFSTYAGSFNGSNAYLSVPASSGAWDVGASSSDNWTIDFWIKTSSASAQYLLTDYINDNERWLMYYYPGVEGFTFYLKDNGSNIIGFSTSASLTTVNSDWHHIALCKVADEYGLYVDGVQYGYTQDSDTNSINGTLVVGKRDTGGGGNYFNGLMDEIRVQKSNYFNASPNSGKTDTFAVPTEEYTEDAVSTKSQLIYLFS